MKKLKDPMFRNFKKIGIGNIIYRVKSSRKKRSRFERAHNNHCGAVRVPASSLNTAKKKFSKHMIKTGGVTYTLNSIATDTPNLIQSCKINNEEAFIEAKRHMHIFVPQTHVENIVTTNYVLSFVLARAIDHEKLMTQSLCYFEDKIKHRMKILFADSNLSIHIFQAKDGEFGNGTASGLSRVRGHYLDWFETHKIVDRLNDIIDNQ